MYFIRPTTLIHPLAYTTDKLASNFIHFLEGNVQMKSMEICIRKIAVLIYSFENKNGTRLKNITVELLKQYPE